MTEEQLKRGKEIELHIKNLKQRFRIFEEGHPVTMIQCHSIEKTRVSAFSMNDCSSHTAKPDYMLTDDRAEKYVFLRGLFIESLERLYLAELADLEQRLANL